MTLSKYFFILLGVLSLQACMTMPQGNKHVPQPAKSVDLTRYAGKWYEVARYENRFEKGCEAVTAEYTARADGLIEVVNTCHENAVGGPVKTSIGKAKILPGSGNAKLKVSFFGPFYIGDYWVLDHAQDYSWSIVGEPSGKYLWLLSRRAVLTDKERQRFYALAKKSGYDTSLLRMTKQ